MSITDRIDIKFLKNKASLIRKETLRLHGLAPETRIASSLSPVEILVALYYGKILEIDPCNRFSEKRDRFVISKAHGSISLFPILADFGFFDKSALNTICRDGTFLGSIPDPTIPGYETINGSLGNGLGVAYGMAIGLRLKGSERSVFVLSGDGELYEGSVWEAIMFASEHRLDSLNMIIDDNQACMLDYCRNIINVAPLEKKFNAFGWDVSEVDGHNIHELHSVLYRAKGARNGKPKVIIARTVKGKGVPRLESDPLCHIKSLSKEEIDILLAEL